MGKEREKGGSPVSGKKGAESVSALIRPDDWMDGCEGAEMMITNNSLSLTL